MWSFDSAVREELERAREANAPLKTRHEALAVIMEEFEEFKALVFLKDPEPEDMRKELIQIAAMCRRTIEDLGF